MISNSSRRLSLGTLFQVLHVRLGFLGSFALVAVAAGACGANVVVDESGASTGSSTGSGNGGGSLTTGQSSSSQGGSTSSASTASGYGGSIPGCDDTYSHVIACIPAQGGSCPDEGQATQDALAAAVGLCSQTGDGQNCCGQNAIYGLATCQPAQTADGRCCYVADTETLPCGASSGP